MTIASTWKEYNKITLQLSRDLGGSDHVVRKYAIRLMSQYLNDKPSNASYESRYLDHDGELFRVESARLERGTTTQLGAIESWDFDYLAVILFDMGGSVRTAYIVPAGVAKRIAVFDGQKNGHVITTNRNFFNCRMYEDITDEIKKINRETVSPKGNILLIKSRGFSKLGGIAGWAKHPESVCHRIIKAYLKLSQEQDVKKDDLCALCGDHMGEPGFYVESFSRNFRLMKTDAGNSHGKVFLEDNGYVLIYPQVLNEIEEHFLNEHGNTDFSFNKQDNCNALASNSVIDGAPVLHAYHHHGDDEEDRGGWFFFGVEGIWDDDLSVVALKEIVYLDQSLNDVMHIPPGWHASREYEGAEWAVEKD